MNDVSREKFLERCTLIGEGAKAIASAMGDGESSLPASHFVEHSMEVYRVIRADEAVSPEPVSPVDG